MSGDAIEAKALLSALQGHASPHVPVAVGVQLGDKRPDIVAAGAAASDLFEFGSLSKTMTAQVLASLVLDATVALDDPISRWLEVGPNGDITLKQLATHTSGLPRMAPNAMRSVHFRPRNPYAHYSAELAEKGLRKATRDDDKSEYSNFGFQLLGLTLERATGRPLTRLLAERVFTPFGLTSIAVGPHPAQVQGRTRGRPAPAWNVQLLGPGGLVGTIGDLLTWGRAVLDPPAGPHGDALRLALEPRAHDAAGTVGLAWHHTDVLTWHNGGTGGFHSCLAVNTGDGSVSASLVAAGGQVEGLDAATMLAARGLDPTGSPTAG
ncbi:MAG: serine hydrolase domain-containing protein [Microthrixaceae bacterium]